MDTKKKLSGASRTAYGIFGVLLVLGVIGGKNLQYMTNWSTAELFGYNTVTVLGFLGGIVLVTRSVRGK